MADFGAIQPRQFIMDSSRQNGATLGEFHQNNNRYLCTLELFDHSVPVTIPQGSDISIKCKKVGTNTVYVLDSSNPDFSSKVSFTPGENKITVDRWAAMVAQDGQILLGVDINGMSTYTVTYTVDKDLIQGTQVIHSETPVAGFVKTDLSNMDSVALKNLLKKLSFAQNDLADVDLQKLSEKVSNTDVGKEISINTKAIGAYDNPKAFNERLNQNAAFIALSKGLHPAVSGLTPEEIKSLFYANRYEETTSVDLTKEPFKDPKVLYLAFQFTSNNQTITQVLPPVSNDQIIMVELIRPKGVQGGKVVFTSASGDLINGTSEPRTLTEDRYNGFWLPVDNETSYDWFGVEQVQQFALSVTDDKNNAVLGVKSLNFKKATLEDDGEGSVTVIPDGEEGTSFVDGILGKEFVPKKVQSLDKTVRIAQFSPGVADFSVDLPHIKEGIFATLGYSEPINTNFHDQRPYFIPRYSHTQRYIGVDLQDKGFTIQDGSTEDPNITGGAAYHFGMWFEPEGSAIATNDGYIELKVIDLMTKQYLVQSDGNVAAVRVEYKNGDKIKPELLIGTCIAKGQQKIAFEIDASFGDQIISASPYTAMFIQQVDKNAGTGLAELFFSNYIGYTIKGADRYYGYNLMNFAAALTKTKGVETLPAGQHELMGNGMFISAGSGSSINVAISDNKLTVMGDGVSIPVFHVGQIFSKLSSYELRLKALATTVKIQDKNNAFVYSLMKWTKDSEATLPILTRYQNDQPIFADGWVQVDKKFISEDAVSGIHTDSNAFTVPDDAKQIALIIYPAVSQIPTTMILADFEADVTPEFSVPTISSAFPVQEYHLKYFDYLYKSRVLTDPKYMGLRYTGNTADTKLPFGIVSGGDGKLVNDRSWNTSGNTWDFEGDGLFKSDGTVTFSYDIPSVYCGESVPDNGTSACEIWLGKKQPDGSFTEVPGSKVAFVVSKDYKGAKHISSGKFSVDVKSGDSFRLLFKADIDDGVYIQSGDNGIPLLQITADFNELEPIDQRIVDLINSKK